MEEQPITAWHRSRGVALAVRDGGEAPTGFGAVDSEIAAMLEGCGLVDLSAEGHLAVTGKHRARFLHAMTTCQVKTLVSGQGNYGLAVDRGGKLVGQFWLDCEGERLVLSAAGAMLETLREHFIKHRVADDVQFGAMPRATVLGLIGPGSEGVLAEALGEAVGVDAAYGWRDAQIAKTPVRIRRNEQRLRAAGYDVTVAAEQAVAVYEALAAAGATPVGTEAFDVVRVGRGVPRDGLDMGEANIPLESQVLYDTMDWDKGCYIGQEVIAMMHYRGRPNRHLVALRLSDAAPLPQPGEEVLAEDGKPVGVLGSAVTHPRLGGAVALAVVKRKYTEPGTTLTLPNTHQATLTTLPLL
ncbi:MAG: glycine cleavage T C-terminal barrel domain-containing protein [Myxococcota bacterium]